MADHKHEEYETKNLVLIVTVMLLVLILLGFSLTIYKVDDLDLRIQTLERRVK